METKKSRGFFLFVALICFCFVTASGVTAAEVDIKLPQPSFTSDVPIEKALAERRSLRTYKDQPVAVHELSQLLWAAQGITEPEKGFRTAPSGMATYPLNVYAVTLNVKDLPRAVYQYDPESHGLIQITKDIKREDLKNERRPPGGRAGSDADSPAEAPPARIAGHADPIPTTPLIFVITGDSTKTMGSSGCYLEAGHAAQNIVLQCVPLGMGGVTMAGFSADKVKELLQLAEEELPIYMIPVGKK